MRNRLLLVLVGVVALVLAVHDIPLAGHLNRVERDRLVTSLERDAFIMAGRAEEALEDGLAVDDPVLRSMVWRYSREEQVQGRDHRRLGYRRRRIGRRCRRRGLHEPPGDRASARRSSDDRGTLLDDTWGGPVLRRRSRVVRRQRSSVSCG